jgi:hypothetical protein
MPRTLQDDAPTIARVAELYGSGLSARLVGEELGVEKSTVLNFMRRNGIERRQRVGGLAKVLPDDPATIARVTELYNSGLGLHELAGELAVGFDVVRRFMVRNDIDRRAKKRPVLMGESPEDVERVKTLYESGMNVSEVAEAEGVTWGTVAAFMERHGIEARPTSGPDSGRWIENISYIGAHARVKSVRGQATTCTKCGTTDGRIEWAHMSDDLTAIDDFAEMCVSCHRAHDAAERKVKGYKRTRRQFDGPTYQLVHMRVRKAFGSANDYPCVKCGATYDDLTHNGYMHWANLSNDYHDVNDFAAMCPACHGVYDAERKRNGTFVPFAHPKEITPQEGAA